MKERIFVWLLATVLILLKNPLAFVESEEAIF